jgi:hypothetical protein
MTPHTLRRTFASILAACDVPPRRAMYLMGHTDAKFTMSVYQQVLDMGRGSVEALERSLAAPWPRPARCTSATAFSHPIPTRERKRPPPSSRARPGRPEKWLVCRGFRRSG